MFVSFTDWEFDGNVDNAVEGIKANWAEMKKYGAVNDDTINPNDPDPATFDLPCKKRASSAPFIVNTHIKRIISR